MYIIENTEIIAFIIAAIIAFAGWRFRLLSLSGAISAAFVGGTIFAFGGIGGAVLLVFFFITGSLLSKLNHSRPLSVKTEAEGRNWKQVLCNGAIPSITLLVIAFRHDLREEISLLFLGALATATADTWATEIGTRFGKHTYNVFTFRRMQKGLSGGISLIGTLAGIAGAFAIAAIAEIRFAENDPLCGLVLVKTIPVVTLAGFLGAFIDSIIGATIQAKYKLPDGSITERKTEGAVLISGIPIIGNNATNLISTLWGGILAIWLGAMI